MHVLVFGASGYIGSHLVPRLVEAGHRVRATSRNAETLAGRDWTGVETLSADALDPGSLDRALQGIDVAYYLVHSMAAGSDFAERDRRAARNFRKAAERAGIDRIIYLGGLQPPAGTGTALQSHHLASRQETGDLLREGPVPVTEFRAGIIVGAGSAAFEVIRDLANHLRVMVTPRWVRSRTQPIALDDLLEYLTRAPGIPETADRTFDIGGPEILSYEQMIRQFAAVVGKRVAILPVPILSPRLSSYWLDLVTAVPASVARPLIDGLKHDLLARDSEIRRLVPLELHTYRQAIVRALETERTQAVPARWQEGALAFRAGRPDISFYSRSTGGSATSRAPVEATWAAIASLGGSNGWPAYSWLWRLRAILDRLIGGTGFRRGRRHPTEVRVGDTIDWWRVVATQPGRRLTLLAEMKVPGAAILELEVTPGAIDGTSEVTATAYFHPAGLWGLIYWIALIPVHGPIFRGLAHAIAARAEAPPGQEASSASEGHTSA